MEASQAQMYAGSPPPTASKRPRLPFSRRRQNLQTPSFSFHISKRLRRDVPQSARPTPIVTVSGNNMMTQAQIVSAPAQTNWVTPTTGLQRPNTIHEGFSFGLEGNNEMATWDAAAVPMQHTQSQQMTTPSDTVTSRPLSVHQEMYTATSADNNTWLSKPAEDNLEFHGIDPDLTIGQAFTTDEAVPIIDMRYQNQAADTEHTQLDHGFDPRRISGSSFTVSSTAGMSDMPTYDEFSTALSDAPSLTSDFPPFSNRNSLLSTTQLSPVVSPRMTPQSRTDMVRTQSRGRASPSPRPGSRVAPYSLDQGRNKRWSTGSYGPVFAKRPSSYHASMPFNYNMHPMQHQQSYATHAPPPVSFHRNSMLLPSQLPSQTFDPYHGHFHPHPHAHPHQSFDQPPPLLSHGLFRMLSSNADPHTLHGHHYTDLSDPPDLFASLNEEQIPPPPEDMNPSDPDLIPHEQELRFEGDLYTPKWVRGHGNKREGWCGICKPGRWLVLKNSAFWYDKSFTHGISAATGAPFQEPQETRRMDGNPDVWEGLCGSCGDWIALVSSKKKGTTWFRHAYKCHTHPKIKDATKRRRESSHTRLAASMMAQPKVESVAAMPHQQQQQNGKPDAQQTTQTPVTPEMTPTSVAVSLTPTPSQQLGTHSNLQTPLYQQPPHQQQMPMQPQQLTPQHQQQHTPQQLTPAHGYFPPQQQQQQVPMMQAPTASMHVQVTSPGQSMFGPGVQQQQGIGYGMI